jgi:protease-4
MGGLATSGGYYVSANADQIFAERTTLTGNIGVLMERFNYTELGRKVGVADATIVSDGADYKTVGSPFQPETPEARAYLTSLANGMFATFKDVVKQGRGPQLAAMKQTLDGVCNGKVYTADEAIKLGLVDQTGYLDDAVAFAAQRAGVKSPTVVRYERPLTFASLLGAKSPVGGAAKAEAVVVEFAGAKLAVSREALYELSTPRPLMLWTGR